MDTFAEYVMEQYKRIVGQLEQGDDRLSLPERQFTLQDGTECAMYDQDITLLMVVMTMIPDPERIDVALNN